MNSNSDNIKLLLLKNDDFLIKNLAKKTNSDVLPANSLFNNSMPTDVSMNLNKLTNEEEDV